MIIELFEVLRTALRNKPRAARVEQFDEFLAAIRADQKRYLPRLAEYYFYSNVAKITVREERLSTVVVPRTPARRETVVDHYKTMKTKLREVILLDLVLPTGKRLRESTFADCAKAGGWFAEISRHGAPAGVIDRHLTEDDLRNIWTRFTATRHAA